MTADSPLAQYVGKYRLVKMVITGMDMSEAYVNGWADKSLYMLFEITPDARILFTAHKGDAEKVFTYYLDPAEMKYYTTPDHAREGIQIRVEDDVLTEESPNHLMVYVRTDEV